MFSSPREAVKLYYRMSLFQSLLQLLSVLVPVTQCQVQTQDSFEEVTTLSVDVLRAGHTFAYTIPTFSVITV